MVTIEGGNSGGLPAWMQGLKGAGELKVVRKEIRAESESGIDVEAEIREAMKDLPPGGPRRVVIKKAIRLSADEERSEGPDEGTFDLRISLPADLSGLAERMDPLIPIYTVGRSVRDLEEKLTELVQVARAEGKSWTEIGKALEISKQAAWERFSGEE